MIDQRETRLRFHFRLAAWLHCLLIILSSSAPAAAMAAPLVNVASESPAVHGQARSLRVVSLLSAGSVGILSKEAARELGLGIKPQAALTLRRITAVAGDEPTVAEFDAAEEAPISRTIVLPNADRLPAQSWWRLDVDEHISGEGARRGAAAAGALAPGGSWDCKQTANRARSLASLAAPTAVAATLARGAGGVGERRCSVVRRPAAAPLPAGQRAAVRLSVDVRPTAHLEPPNFWPRAVQ